jgi:c(7)-type cytochrome triheme protein
MNRLILILVAIFILTASITSARWIDDKVVIQTENVGNVNFSHYNHLDAVGQDCPTCHNSIFNIDRKKNSSFSMADMEKGKSCGACHNGNRAFSVSGDCASCHAGEIEIAGVTFQHSIHVDMYGCDDCHSDIFEPTTKNAPVSMSQMENGKSCGACHNGDDAFSVTSDCGTCHSTREITFKTAGAGNILFSHDLHTEMVSCADCHSRIYKSGDNSQPITMAQMEKGRSCGACHNGGIAFAVSEDCSSCHPTRDITFSTESVGKIMFSHEIHTSMFGCSDCHPDLYQPNANNQTKTMAQMENGESCGACHDGGDAFSVTEDCSSCHPTREITFKEKEMGNVLFSHDVHTSMFGCSDCHPDVFKAQSDNKPVSMEEMEAGESCGACHDGGDAFSVAEDCETCHTAQ